jgi:hypothetical protein
VCEHNRQVLA